MDRFQRRRNYLSRIIRRTKESGKQVDREKELDMEGEDCYKE